MKVGLELNREKKEEEQQEYKEPPLSKYGVNVIKNDRHDGRVKENVSTQTYQWSKESLDSFGHLSPVKREILKRANDLKGYLERNAPEGKAKENPRFSAAIVSVQYIMQEATRLAFSDCSDEAAFILANDLFSDPSIVVAHTYDSKNTGITDAFTITGMPIPAPKAGETHGQPTA